LVTSLEGLIAEIQGALVQSSQLSQTLIGQFPNLSPSGGSQEAETQELPTQEQGEDLGLILDGIVHMRAWDQGLLEEIPPILGLLRGRSSPGISDYWFFESLSDQVVSILARTTGLLNALRLKDPGTPQACQIQPNSRFLCDESAWEGFRKSFIIENYGSPALSDPRVNDTYAWSLAYIGGVLLKRAQEDLRQIAQGLPSASPLLPLLNENLAVLGQAGAFIGDRLGDYPRIPPMGIIEAADFIPQSQGDGDNA
jgi:hypothetical protein